jgi:MFS family permease
VGDATAGGRLGGLDALVITSLIWFLAKFLRYAFPPLFGQFRAEYGLSNAALGAAFAGMMLCYAAMQFPSGALADRVGPVRVITGGALLAALAAALVSAAGVGGLPVLLVGMLLVGAGTGAHKTVAVTLLPAVYPDSRGRMLGALDTFGTFGGAAAPAAVLAVLAVGLDWEWLFLGAAVAGVAFAVAFARCLPRRLPAGALDGGSDARVTDGGADGDGLGRYLVLFADRRLAAFVAVTVLFSVAYNGAVAFLPLYLTDQTALTEGGANLLYGGLFLVSVVQPATGEAGDRLGELPVVGATLALATAGLLALLAVDAPWAATLAVVALGLGSHGFRPVRGAYLLSVVPDAVAGGTLGVVRTVIMGAGALAPAAVGLLADAAGFGAAFGLLAAALLGALVTVGALLWTATD